MTEQPLRIGLVGCGGHGANLAQAVARTPGLRLVACADPDADAARRAASAASDVTLHSSIDSVLQSGAVDAILVATPHDVLAPLALTAVRAGKHVMVEKPRRLMSSKGRKWSSPLRAPA